MMELANLLRFPCNDAKRPLMSGWQRNAGRFDHSRWPLVGVPTGEANGFDVVDVDVEGLDWFEQNRRRLLPKTRLHRTRSGGLHLLFRHAAGLRCSAGRIAPGVDVRADGGFVVWWPREGFAVEGRGLAEWPHWLLVRATLRTPREVKAPCKSSHGHGDVGPTLDLRLRTGALVRRVEQTQPGERNKLLNWAAFRFGEMIAEGVIKRSVAEKLLVGAAKANGLWREDGAAQCGATIRSGIDAGLQTQHHQEGELLHGASTGAGMATGSGNGRDIL
jgi:hypothetical protein